MSQKSYYRQIYFNKFRHIMDTMERVIVFMRNLNHPYSMWISGKFDQQTHKDLLFSDLHQECKLCPPGRQLNHTLRYKLERLSQKERSELVNQVKDGCSPLFLACKKGNIQVVKFLIETCHADPEMKGFYQVQDDNSVHLVSPLWAASVSGQLEVVKYLVREAHVDVNSCSDTGSTPLRSACFMTHYEVVKFLIEQGADISKKNQNGGTCLINSVQSVDLCELLLINGADVNAKDIQRKTALHYAIQEHRLETTILLLKYGADPTIKSRFGEDALQTACLKLAVRIVSYLINNFNYSNERIACAYELLGCTFLDEQTDLQNALEYWKMAMNIRLHSEPRPIPKQNLVPPKKAYQFMQEFTTMEELERIDLNLDAMRLQSLLMCERILGSMHKELLFRLMYRGASYADNLNFQRCIDMWNYSLQLRVQKDTILSSDSCITSISLANLYLDLFEVQQQSNTDDQLNFADVYETAEILLDNITEVTQLLQIRPVFKKQLENFDTTLKVITNLLYLMRKLEKKEAEQKQLVDLVHRLLQLNLRSSSGHSFLHLAVSPNLEAKSFSIYENLNSPSPDCELVDLLLDCGADPNSINNFGQTPLHLVCTRINLQKDIAQLLLKKGAHFDRVDFKGSAPVQMLFGLGVNCVDPLEHITLKCLAARRLAQSAHPRDQIPHFLREFVQMH